MLRMLSKGWVWAPVLLVTQVCQNAGHASQGECGYALDPVLLGLRVRFRLRFGEELEMLFVVLGLSSRVSSPRCARGTSCLISAFHRRGVVKL